MNNNDSLSVAAEPVVGSTKLTTKCTCDTLPLALPRSLSAGHGRRPDLVGDLADLPLPLLLQTLAATGRTATIFFPLGASAKPSPWLSPLQFWAGFALRDGLLLDAIAGPHRGCEALVRLALTARSQFEVRFDALLWPVDPDLRAVSVDSSLMRATLTIDEARRILGRLPLDRELLPRDKGAATTARSFLLNWPGSLLTGAEEIAAALLDGLMTLSAHDDVDLAPSAPFDSGFWSAADGDQTRTSGLDPLGAAAS
jgi:hypothetical protein